MLTVYTALDKKFNWFHLSFLYGILFLLNDTNIFGPFVSDLWHDTPDIDIYLICEDTWLKLHILLVHSLIL